MIVKINLALSLDGFVAREDGSLDWLPQPGDIPEGEDFGFGQFLSSVDLLAMGRASFETVLGFGDWPYGTLRTEVLTTRSLDIPGGLETIVSRAEGTPRALRARWEREGRSAVYLDGGETVRRFLADGLVDEMTLTRVPVLLGRGRGIFPDTERSALWEHQGTDHLPLGLVRSRYRRR